MMVWRGEDAQEVRFNDRPVLALGFFDGVHRGHQALVRRAVTDARRQGRPAGVLTFEPHPLAVVGRRQEVSLLTTPEEKEELLAKLGVERTIVYPFSRDLAELSPESFARKILREQLGVAEVVVGYNFSFGAGGTGRYALLRKLGKALGFQAAMIPPVTAHREVVSSTAIRERLSGGRVEEARWMLGYPYFLRGRVIRGAGRGHGLGFPTANLALPPGKLTPGDGVYLVGVVLPGSREERPGLAAVGQPLTFASDRRQIEVHLLGWAGDLYGADVQVSFHRRLREMRCFPSREGLQEQVREDLRRAEALWPILYSR
ncbi:MAG: bifunctional riboflavin kinase/FAD synthetase [Betaproteobacteria bacterium]